MSLREEVERQVGVGTAMYAFSEKVSVSEARMAMHADLERRWSEHIGPVFTVCDLGNENCEHWLRRNAAYKAYTKRPHPSEIGNVNRG